MDHLLQFRLLERLLRNYLRTNDLLTGRRLLLVLNGERFERLVVRHDIVLVVLIRSHTLLRDPLPRLQDLLDVGHVGIGGLVPVFVEVTGHSQRVQQSIRVLVSHDLPRALVAFVEHHGLEHQVFVEFALAVALVRPAGTYLLVVWELHLLWKWNVVE